ncbi:acyl-CoA dehydrogenase family protein [Blastococcus sp. CT_GayMR16]|uniref:acyl-CoA dehydrogenase family protein n=1 Tax=Blastococcus sp. CT_GayMR16 TaxID=2559607 RepID=UPI0010746FC3|nr:acyl-CoA dehydrogenase family protein [Blastococcus sp. CT_GayMR16]TFV88871.1 acyl-CoA dehydrogenase [Blastococcus sp. CT_GayMR16]
MDFGTIELTPEQQEFADEVRSFLDALVTPDVLEHERAHGDGFNERVHLALGSRGWLTPQWSPEDGGAGLDPLRRRILELELQRHRVPDITAGTTNLVWTAVDRFADPSLRDELAPRVADGTARFCLGYTDPEGGSDIAASRLRAVRDGDEWVLNGAKMFTTGAQNCQYTFLIARTDPELPKHKGLTMFLVPLAAPGVEIQAIRTFGGERTNAVYYGDVRISDRYRLGGVNDGWAVLHGPLDEEHSVGTASDGLADPSVGRSFLRPLEVALDETLAWARETGPDGSRPVDDPSVVARLARVAVELEAGVVTPGPMGRVKGSLAIVEGAAELLDLTGAVGLLSPGADGALGDGDVDFAHRWAQGTATYGGTVEVFRTIIAQHVLGLPRAGYPGSKVLM